MNTRSFPFVVEKNLERDEKCDKNRKIMCLTLLCTEKPSVVSFVEQRRDFGLAVHYLGNSNFVVVSFLEPRVTEDEKKDITPVIRDIITRGISYNSQEYHFFAHSNSQLKSRSCYMYKANPSIIEDIIDKIARFPEAISKRVKYIGLLFTGCQFFLDAKNFVIEDIGDVSNKEYTFTDGCGMISPNAAIAIAREYKKIEIIPSVFQIRYKGYKGVLVVDNNLSGSKIQFRKSMNKIQFLQKDWKLLGIAEYSRPDCFGYLNTQLIVLLSALGVPDYILNSKHEENLHCIANMTTDAAQALHYLITRNYLDIAEKFLQKVTPEICEKLKGFQDSEFERMTKESPNGIRDKLRIFLPNSRCIFGVADFTKTLKSGQCFFQTRIGYRDMPFQGKVIVARNPCYHPGDIRILEAVNVPSLSHLKECIVFPVVGARPHPDEMAGGDLDGDKYFVCWDNQILHYMEECQEPLSYKPPVTSGQPPIFQISRQDYFANYCNSDIGMIDTIFMKYANDNAYKAISKACNELAKMFACKVDHMPDESNNNLKNLRRHAPTVSINSNVWTNMINNQKKEIVNLRSPLPHKSLNYQLNTRKDLLDLLRSEKIKYLVEPSRLDRLERTLKENRRVDYIEDLPDSEIKIEEIEISKKIESCTYDCYNFQCLKNHPSLPERIYLLKREIKEKLEIFESEARIKIRDLQIEYNQFQHHYTIEDKKLELKSNDHSQVLATRNEITRKLSPVNFDIMRVQKIHRKIHKQLNSNLNKFKASFLSFFGNKKFEDEMKKMKENIQKVQTDIDLLKEQQSHYLQVLDEIKQKEAVFLKEIHSIQISITNWDSCLRKTREKHANECTRIYPIQKSIERIFQILLADPKTREEIVGMVRKMKSALNRVVSQNNSKLPLLVHKENIIGRIQSNQVLIVTAGTGSGKSTQIVQYIEDAFLRRDGLVCCTQPRRIAATGVCENVAQSYLCQIGEEVAYHIGGEKKISGLTGVKFVTERILLNEMENDNTLSKYSVIMIDEAHERHIDTDILLAQLKEIMKTRPDLKIIIMSASIDVVKFANYFGTNNMIDVKVKSPYEVKIEELPKEIDEKYVKQAYELALKIHLNSKEGDILVFLAGKSDIEEACSELESQIIENDYPEARILPLYRGSKFIAEATKEPKDERKKKLRRIIFATNIAETSLTIPGLKFVIDSGRYKKVVFDPKTSCFKLILGMISRASAKQRKGRVGRKSVGECYRLFNYKSLLKYGEPEILSTDLTETYVQLKKMGKRLETFPFLDRPSEESIQYSIDLLRDLDFIDENGDFTEDGKIMSKLTVHPQMARALMTSVKLNCLEEMIIVAAIVACDNISFFKRVKEKDFEAKDNKKRYSKFRDDPTGDHMTMIKIFKEWKKIPENGRQSFCQKNQLSSKGLKLVDEKYNMINYNMSTELKKASPKDTVLYQDIAGCLISGYFRNICSYASSSCKKLERYDGYYLYNTVQRLLISKESTMYVTQRKWLLFNQISEGKMNLFISMITPIEPEWIKIYAPKYYSRVQFTPETTPFKEIIFKAGSLVIEEFLKEKLPQGLTSEKYQSSVVITGLRSILEENENLINSKFKQAYSRIIDSDKKTKYLHGLEVNFGTGAHVVAINKAERYLFVRGKVNMNRQAMKILIQKDIGQENMLLLFQNAQAADKFRSSYRNASICYNASIKLSSEEIDFFKPIIYNTFVKDKVFLKKERLEIKCTSESEREEVFAKIERIMGKRTIRVKEKIINRIKLENLKLKTKCFIRLDREKKKIVIKGKTRDQDFQVICDYLRSLDVHDFDFENLPEWKCPQCQLEHEDIIYLKLCGHAFCWSCLEKRIEEIMPSKMEMTCSHGCLILFDDLEYFSDYDKLLIEQVKKYQRLVQNSRFGK